MIKEGKLEKSASFLQVFLLILMNIFTEEKMKKRGWLSLFLVSFFLLFNSFESKNKAHDDIFSSNPRVIVTSPNGGERLPSGSVQTISWRYEGITPQELGHCVEIDLLKGGRLHSILNFNELSISGLTCSFRWEMPLFMPAGNDYKIRIAIENCPYKEYPYLISMSDESDGYFTIFSGGKVAFCGMSDVRTPTADIFLIDENGLVNLTNTPDVSETSPSISPLWDKIAFVSGEEIYVRSEEIYLMNIDGTRRTRLTNNSFSDKDPSWSPTGDKIIFASDREGNFEIYVMNPDGSNLQRLTNNGAVDRYPAWSPRGDKIAFISDREGYDEIYIMNSNGLNPQKLTTLRRRVWDLAWSPDAAKIVFSAKELSDYFHIYLINADGTGLRQLTFASGDQKNPSWSVDNSKIVYSSNETGPYQIYVLDISGPMAGRIRRLSESLAVAWSSNWSPRPPLTLKPLVTPKPVIKKIKNIKK